MSLSISILTSAYTLTSANYQAYMCDATNGSFTVTLPDATGQDGGHFYIKRTDTIITNSITIACQNGQKIDLAATASLTSKKFYHLMAYNNGWWIIG